jgi:hypothetical protein
MATPRMTKQDKAHSETVDREIRDQIQNVSFDIFDLQKLHDAGMEASRSGTSIKDAVASAVAKYRKN